MKNQAKVILEWASIVQQEGQGMGINTHTHTVLCYASQNNNYSTQDVYS